jgi:hypothetical protein
MDQAIFFFRAMIGLWHHLNLDMYEIMPNVEAHVMHNRAESVYHQLTHALVKLPEDTARELWAAHAPSTHPFPCILFGPIKH